MTLLNLIRGKSTPTRLATATPATLATQAREMRAVATAATVAVAMSPQEQSAPLNEPGAGDTAPTFRWWLIHYPDREPEDVACCPAATHAEILERHPDAVAAEPYTRTIRRPKAPMTVDEESAIREWLALIEETDPAAIVEVIDQCQRNADERDYFIGRAAAELPKSDLLPDDRRTCNQCSNLIAGRCQAAKHGEIVASQNHEPVLDLAQRCEGYAPGADDPDRRSGRERWFGLINKGANDVEH